MDEYSPSSRGRHRDDSLDKALGHTIKVLRTDRGLGRKELAEIVGISYSYLTEIENGTKPASNTYLSLVAEALGVQLSELIEAAEARLQPGERTIDEYDVPTWSPAPWGTPQLSLSDQAGSRSGERLRRGGGNAVAPPSARRLLAHRPPPSGASGGPSSRPTPEAASAREVLDQLAALIPSLSPEDQRRVLDMARRLAR